MSHGHDGQQDSSSGRRNPFEWGSPYNPFGEYLEDNPYTAYQEAIGSFGKTPTSRNFFQNQFSNIHNQFLGKIGAQILGSEAPSALWTDFLGDFDFQKHEYGFTPGQRGRSSARFTPRTRFIPQG